jgi:hypothetical protein
MMWARLSAYPGLTFVRPERQTHGRLSDRRAVSASVAQGFTVEQTCERQTLRQRLTGEQGTCLSIVFTKWCSLCCVYRGDRR